jgi:cytosine/adenosine deaminase-related metal-dependent hydrolase
MPNGSDAGLAKERLIMPQPDLLISGGHVVTLDPAIGDLAEGDVLIRDGTIAAVGAGLGARAPRARVLDARGRLVLPGLVDTHRHVWQGALGGHTGQVSLSGYSSAVIAGLAPHYTPDDIYAGTLWGALQALNAGITTIADWSHNLATPRHADANVRALHDSGIRGVFLYGGPGPDGLAFFGVPAPSHPGDARRAQAEHFPDGASGRLRMGLALRGPAFTTLAGRTSRVAGLTLNPWPTTSRRFVTSGSFSSSSSIFPAWPSSRPSTTRTLAPCSG